MAIMSHIVQFELSSHDGVPRASYLTEHQCVKHLRRLVVFLALAGSLAGSGRPAVGFEFGVGAAGTEPFQSTSKGTIGGQVVDDAGKPISGASVIISRIGENRPARNATTDDDGKYSVSDLSPAACRVAAEAPAFVSASQDDTGASSVYRTGDTADIKLVKGGVITGTVHDLDGTPVVAIQVQVVRVKDSSGGQTNQSEPESRRTDDRGIYRIYGLSAGKYLVFAGGPASWNQGLAYVGDGPTYYPSATIDTAEEVAVETGQEITGIDIAYRGGHAHAVSGTVSDNVPGATDSDSTDQVLLRHAATGNIFGQTSTGYGRIRSHAFAFEGVPDGEYDILVEGMKAGQSVVRASIPLKVTIKGADVTGLNLVVGPLGSISGAVVLAPLPDNQKPDGCKGKPVDDFLRQTVISALPDRADGTYLLPAQGGALWGSIDEKGTYSITGLPSGTYHLEVSMPGGAWYVRSIESREAPASKTAQGGPGAARAAYNSSARSATARLAAGGGIGVKTGENVKDIVLTLSEGAAVFSGKVAGGADTKSSNKEGSALRVYLVPKGQEERINPQAFVESPVDSRGKFEMRSAPPGKYMVVAQPVPVVKNSRGPLRKASWDAALRKSLIDRADKLTSEAELKTCGALTDYSVVNDPSAGPGPQTPVRF